MSVVGGSYARAQWVSSFVTAASHVDRATRERALRRAGLWQQVLDGMAIGLLNIGSPQPVSDLPTWVTLNVMRGGFATGVPQAAGEPTPFEHELAAAPGSPAQVRAACFEQCLTEPGLHRLWSLLDSGMYRVDVPEAAALLTVAWLVRAGHVATAIELVDVLRPLSARLRFVPVVMDAPEADPSYAWHRTTGQVRDGLGGRRPRPQIAAMVETLTVWNPFRDEVLTHWLATRDAAGRVGCQTPPGWGEGTELLLGRYAQLAAQHRLCSKHRRPKENLAALLAGLAESRNTADMSADQLARVRHAVDSIVARHGEPGSPQHAQVRARQAANASQAAWTDLARLLAGRLADCDPDRGLENPDAFSVPVTEAEALQFAAEAGTPTPARFVRSIEQAREATIPALVDAGAVPSAEELARLVPHLTAETVASAYPDPQSRRLMGYAYRTFRQRRSLLLVKLAHQARFNELPWVSALTSVTDSADKNPSTAQAALTELGRLTLDAWPSTLIPNRLVTEFSTLATQAGLLAPFTDELAADIFEGTFTFNHQRAAQMAATVISGSLYSRYFQIDTAAISAIAPPNRGRDGRYEPASEFAELCHRRAGLRRARSVAENGATIEQSQVLTTHNLAVLVAVTSVEPRDGWALAAATSLHASLRLLRRARNDQRPLRSLKNAAYAWRQAVFYLSMMPDAAASATIGDARAASLRTVSVAGVVHAGLLDDLQQASTAASPAAWRPFYGWATTDHQPVLNALRAGR